MFSSFTSVTLFLQFFGASGKRTIEEIERLDLETFIEHEKDRGMYISTVKVRMASIVAFLYFLMEQDVVSPALLERTIKLYYIRKARLKHKGYTVHSQIPRVRS
jgi:site-specific recombinase XerD